VAKLVLERGADASVQDWEGKTAFAVASESANKEVLELLASSGRAHSSKH